MPPRGRKVVLKAIPVQKSSAKSMSVENVMLHEEEEAERRLLNDKRQSEDDALLDDSASISGEEVPAPLSTGANKRSIFVTDPEELEMLERLREKKLRTISSSGADTPISLREDGAYSDITTSSSLQDRAFSFDRTPNSSLAFDEHPRRFSKKRPVQINVPSDQLRIEDLRLNEAILTKILNAPHFAGIQNRSTRSKYYVRLTDEMPRQEYNIYLSQPAMILISSQ